jgi:MFS family permease
MGTFGVHLIDRIGRTRAFALAAAGMVGGVVLLCIGPAWPVTLFGTVMSGLGGALLNMLMPGVIHDHHGEHRAVAFAAVNAVPAVAGVAFSLLVGAALGADMSWRVPYLGVTAVFTIAFVLVARPVRPPAAVRSGSFSLVHLRRREVLVPMLFMVNGALAEFPIGIWAVTYLRDVGNASSGLAPILAIPFALAMFTSRIVLPRVLARFGQWSLPFGFVLAAVGATAMFTVPRLAVITAGLAVVGFGGGLLYPLTIDRFYSQAGHVLDSVSLGAYAALASGVAITVGPLGLGVLAELVGLRWAIVVVPALGLLGAITQRPRP